MFSQEAWNKGFAALQKFKKREGHCLVPRHHVEGAYRLGQWVSVQRYTQGSIGAKRKAQLNKIGFVWSTLDLLWANGFAALERFKSREGHCLVPALHVELKSVRVRITSPQELVYRAIRGLVVGVPGG